MKATFFKSAAEFRSWLRKNHAIESELWVGFHKKDSGKPSITWPESVEEALCYGWIDGIRKRIDDISYTNRFTPRKLTSNWSAINIRRVGDLQKKGLMRAPGLKAFGLRKENRSGTYSYEQRSADLPEPYQKKVKQHKDSIESFMPAGRQDLVDIETAQMKVLEKYLPQQMDEAVVRSLVQSTIKDLSATPADFGKVMKEVLVRAKGQTDGTVVSKLVKEELK